MLKRLFLHYKAAKLNNNKEHTSFSSSQTIGLLYNQDQYTGSEISSLKERLEKEGKNVAVLGYESKPTEDPLLFNRKDISLTGNIVKNTVEFFVKQPFDFLLTLNDKPDINYRYVLALSHAACKIGFETDYYADLLQMSLQMKPDNPRPIEDMVKYLKMIS